MSYAKSDKRMQDDFIKWCIKHGVRVSCGLKPGGGITIRSQDDRVDASNIGEIHPYSDGESSGTPKQEEGETK